MKQETLADLIEYRKRARYVLGKLHRELEKKEEEIKLLEERLKNEKAHFTSSN